MPSTYTDRLNGVSTSVAVKAPVKAVAIAPVTLSGEQTVNGVAVVTGDRVLVTAQVSAVDNGIYDVSTGLWTRAADFDGTSDVVKGTLVVSNTGTTIYYRVTSVDPVVIGSSAIDFEVVSGAVSASSIGAALYPRTAAEIAAAVTPSDYQYEPGNVRRYGATGNGTADDIEAIEDAVAVAAAGQGVVTFPPGTYGISRFIPVVASNIAILGGAGVKIKHLGSMGGYQRDGFRIGNPTATDGGTNDSGSPTFVQNIVVRGFQFESCRIGVWCVYARNVVVEDIWASGIAAVAAGNDNDDDCYRVTFRNIHMVGWTATGAGDPFYAVGVYRTYGFTVDGVYCAANMGITGAAYLQIEHSERGSFANVHIDGVDATKANGIVVASSPYVNGSACTVYRCNSGLVSFKTATGTADTFNNYSDISAIACTQGIQIYTKYNTFSNVMTKSCVTSDLDLRTDAQHNQFDCCQFNPGGMAALVEETAGGNNGKNLQKWRWCIGIQEGKTDAYYGGKHPAFRCANDTAQTDGTGDGTKLVMTFDTTVYDLDSSMNEATGQFTAPIDGIYLFSGSAEFVRDTSTYTSVDLYVRVGATDYLIATDTISSDTVLSGSVQLKVTRGSVVSLVAAASGGSKAADIGGTVEKTWFSGLLVA